MNPTSIKWLAGIAVLLGIIAGSFYAGHHTEALVFEKYQSDLKAADAQRASDSQAAARRKEEANAIATSTAVSIALQQSKAQQAAANATIGKLRTGTLWLSSQLASLRNGAGVPGVGTSGLGTDNATSGRLPVDTAQFLVSESNRADQLAIKFNKAVAIIAADRVTCDGASPDVDAKQK